LPTCMTRHVCRPSCIPRAAAQPAPRVVSCMASLAMSHVVVRAYVCITRHHASSLQLFADLF
jgi:hypothetical protein